MHVFHILHWNMPVSCHCWRPRGESEGCTLVHRKKCAIVFAFPTTSPTHPIFTRRVSSRRFLVPMKLLLRMLGGDKRALRTKYSKSRRDALTLTKTDYITLFCATTIICRCMLAYRTHVWALDACAWVGIDACIHSEHMFTKTQHHTIPALIWLRSAWKSSLLESGAKCFHSLQPASRSHIETYESDSWMLSLVSSVSVNTVDTWVTSCSHLKLYPGTS